VIPRPSPKIEDAFQNEAIKNIKISSSLPDASQSTSELKKDQKDAVFNRLYNFANIYDERKQSKKALYEE
jgi:hypothetical protein